MRIAELSRDSGVPMPTIKYYVREGLLKPGELTSRNQAQYDDSHLRRLRLIRALTEVGGLSIAAVRDLLAAAGAQATSLHDALGKVQYATTPSQRYEATEASREVAGRQADEFIRRHGWRVGADSPARRLLASVLAALHDLGQDDLVALADAYAAPAEQIAAADLAAIVGRQGRDSQLEGVVIGTVLGDALLAALRRLAEENASVRAAPLSRHVRTATMRGVGAGARLCQGLVSAGAVADVHAAARTSTSRSAIEVRASSARMAASTPA
jgi:DNA-binding transcriptional MerR regulator